MPAGSQGLVERDRAGVYCPAGRGVATGRGLGEEEAAQAETIYLAHEEQLGREASSAALQGQVRREERMPGANAASSPVSCPLLPCCLGIQPLRPQQGHRQPFPSPHPLLRLPFPGGCPTDSRLYLLLKAQQRTVRYLWPVRQACASFSRDGNTGVISDLSRATQLRT